jgi:cytoskeleton protein RodZ
MSYGDYDQGPPALGNSRLGAELQLARERLGWNLTDVAANLRIRLPYLVAIEEGRIADLPGNAYAVGFVRTYASSLGLDPDEVARRFRAEAKDVNRKPELSFPAPVTPRGVPAMAVVLLGILIAGGAYIGWYRYSGSAEPTREQTASAPPDRLAAMAPAVQTQSPQVASILPSVKPPVTGSGAGPLNPLPTPPIPVPVPVPVPVAIAPPAPAPVAAPVSTRLVLHAKAGGWVQVREKQGQVLLNRVMHTGETWPVPMKANLILTTSNAGGMEMLVDGTPAPALGAAGGFVKDVPLDPDTLKAGPPKAPPRPRPVRAAPLAAPSPDAAQ